MGIKTLPLCTVKLLSTKWGSTTDRRDQIFDAGFPNFVVLRESAGKTAVTSEKGIFQVDLDMLYVSFLCF